MIFVFCKRLLQCLAHGHLDNFTLGEKCDIRFLKMLNKPENPFQNYDVAKNLKNFQYDNQMYKNRKPDIKPDPGLTGKFYGR